MSLKLLLYAAGVALLARVLWPLVFSPRRKGEEPLPPMPVKLEDVYKPPHRSAEERKPS